jgi:hypothetical protein
MVTAMARPGLGNNPKFRRLVHLLGEPEPHVRGHLESLWEVGYEAGNPIIGDSMDIELAGQWDGEPGRFTESLLECRLVDKVDDGKYAIHDFWSNCPAYVKRRRDAEDRRKQAGITISDQRRAAVNARWRGPTEIQPDTNGEPLVSGCIQPANIRVHDEYKPVQEDTTPSPSPSPSPVITKASSTGVEGPRDLPGKATKEEPPGFSQFWELYPRKVGKKPAIKVWERLKPDGALLEVILRALTAQRQQPSWADKQYVMHPERWLRGERWNDEVVSSDAGPAAATDMTLEKQRENNRLARAEEEAARQAPVFLSPRSAPAAEHNGHREGAQQ